MDYKIVPLIRPKKNTRKDRVFSQFNYPLELCDVKTPLKRLYKRKFFKNGVGYEQVPSYTYKSGAKTTYLSVLLATLIVSKLKPE